MVEMPPDETGPHDDVTMEIQATLEAWASKQPRRILGMTNGISISLAVVILAGAWGVWAMHDDTVKEIGELKLVGATQAEVLRGIDVHLSSIDATLKETATREWVESHINTQIAVYKADVMREIALLRSALELHRERLHQGVAGAKEVALLEARIAILEEKFK